MTDDIRANVEMPVLDMRRSVETSPGYSLTGDTHLSVDADVTAVPHNNNQLLRVLYFSASLVVIIVLMMPVHMVLVLIGVFTLVMSHVIWLFNKFK